LKTNKNSEGELEIDKRTLEKQQEVKEKLKNICEPNQNIDNLLTSLECYCLLILQSLK
jgi:hypothetical protein